MLICMETEIVYSKKPRLKKPVLIEGLPGMGLVGKLAVDHMVTEFKAKEFAVMYSPYFPPQVVIRKDGTVCMMKNTFYYVTGKPNLILLAGDHQGASGSSHYHVCQQCVDLLSKYDCSAIYTLGGLATGKLAKEPRVFGAVNDKALLPALKKAGVSFERTGIAIVGAAGLLIGMSAQKGIPGACLMGETHGQIVDARSSKTLLETLSKLLNVKINTESLDEKAKETEKMIRKAKHEQEKQKALQSLPSGGGPTYIR